MAYEHHSDGVADDTLKTAIARPSRLADEVYELILEQLISLKLPPGARITVDNLAREFGISQTPIREALGRLESHGLVLKTHLIGYHATPQLNREQFGKLYEMRLLLEPEAARKAALKIGPAAIGELRQFATDMRDEVAAHQRVNYGRFARHDGEFHALIGARRYSAPLKASRRATSMASSPSTSGPGSLRLAPRPAQDKAGRDRRRRESRERPPTARRPYQPAAPTRRLAHLGPATFHRQTA